MSSPDLFVVCKNCGSEVSPYVTECPYCGKRVRKRAPNIGPDGEAIEGRRGRTRRRPPARSAHERPEPSDGRPLATIGVIVLSALATLILSTGFVSILDVGLLGPPGNELWLTLSTLFANPGPGYLFVVMLAVGVFGISLERRFGLFAVLVVFLLTGLAGSFAAIGIESYPAYGANSAALGLAFAWLLETRVSLARGADREPDMIGFGVMVAVLALLPFAEPSASFVAGAGGAAAGALLGLLLGSLRR